MVVDDQNRLHSTPRRVLKLPFRSGSACGARAYAARTKIPTMVSFYISAGNTDIRNEPAAATFMQRQYNMGKFPDRLCDVSNHDNVLHWLGAVDFADRLSNGIARLFRLTVFIVQLRDARFYKIHQKAQH
nr:hypothetical protein [uncultured Rhodopila sp.]